MSSVLFFAACVFSYSFVSEQKLLKRLLTSICRSLSFRQLFSCYFQVESRMEVLFHVEMEKRIMPECSGDGADGHTSS